MARQFVNEEEKDLTLPEDSIHRARLIEIKERTFEFNDRNDGSLKTGTNLEWWWEVTVPMAGLGADYIGRRVKGECRPKMSSRAGNRFREWTEALIQQPIPVGGVVDVDNLIGLEADIVIGHRKGSSRVFEEVTDVVPVEQQPTMPPF